MKLKIESIGNGFRVSDESGKWDFFAAGSGYLVTRTDNRRKETNHVFNGATEAQGFLLEVISSRLSLSDFWNGQTALSLTTKNQ